jgi:hypothetical protein
VLRNIGSGEIPFDAAKLAKIRANLEKRGVTFVTGEEGARLARLYGGEAAYIPDLGKPGIIAIGPNASRTAVIEELIHFAQDRKLGFNAIDDVVGLEIAAQHKLLETGRRLGWTPEEMQRIREALEYWRSRQ